MTARWPTKPLSAGPLARVVALAVYVIGFSFACFSLPAGGALLGEAVTVLPGRAVVLVIGGVAAPLRPDQRPEHSVGGTTPDGQK